jgi:hypothetical protein
LIAQPRIERYLWRAELAGCPRDHTRWRVLHEFAHRTFPRLGVPFADWHIALIDAVVGDATAAEACERELDEMSAPGSIRQARPFPSSHARLRRFNVATI